jgi:hypothetical protein
VAVLSGEKRLLFWRPILDFNGRFSDLRRIAARRLLQVRENAASEKVENPMAVLSAQQTSMRNAADGRFEPNLSIFCAAAKVRFRGNH